MKNKRITVSDLARMVKSGFDFMHEQFQKIDERFNLIDRRFDAMDLEFARVNRRIDHGVYPRTSPAYWRDGCGVTLRTASR